MGNINYGYRTYGIIEPRGHGNNITVGRYCSLAKGIVADGGFSHNTKFISTYPFGVPILDHPEAPNIPNLPSHIRLKGDIIIGNDVYIGEDVLLMSGITIGDGAVIGARSIITEDVPPYCIVVGTNRQVRDRFTKTQIKHLLRIKWWNFEDSEIEKIAPILMSDDVNTLIELYS